MSRRIRQRRAALLSGAVLLPLLGLGHASAKSTPIASVAGVPVGTPAGSQSSGAQAQDGSSGAQAQDGQPEGESPPPGEPTPAERAVAYARAQVGKPYHYGSAGPDSYDCSGLTMASWRQGGRELPHSSKSQWSASTRIPTSQLQPGDLLFFGSPIHHVGIYVGDGQMVEAPRSGGRVRLASIQRSDLAGAGRV